MASVSCDFVNDYYEYHLWPAAQAYGFGDKPSDDRGWDRLHMDVLWVDAKKVAVRPRKIKVGPGFSCPPDLQVGLRAFREKVLRGDSLNPHLSLRSDMADKPDGLLTDWGVYHFHLGTGSHPSAPGFVARTGRLLFAWVDDHHIHHIKIGDHGSFEDYELLEAVYRAWPHLLKRFELSGLSGGGRRPTSEELRRARGRLMMPIEIDGKVFAPPGGGVATSGTSVTARTTADYRIQGVEALQKWARENAAVEFRKQGLQFDEPLVLRFEIEGNDTFAVSDLLGARLRLPEVR